MAPGHTESLQASQLSLPGWEARALSPNPSPPALCPRDPQMFRPGHVPAPSELDGARNEALLTQVPP